MTEQATFTYSLLGKASSRKAIEDQGKKQIKAIEDHSKQLVEFNAFVNIDRDRILLKEQKNI